MNENNKKTTTKTTWAKQICFYFFVFILAYLVFFTGYLAGQKGLNIGINEVANKDKGRPQSVDFSLFWQAWNKLVAKSDLSPDLSKMMEGSISGMLSSLSDPYTVYLTKTENKQFKEDIGGGFSGIGIEIIQKNGLPTIVAPLSGMPAEKAGIKAGDVIIEVDGVGSDEMNFTELVDKIRGKEDTTVNIKIIRSGSEDSLNFDVVRKMITIKSVEWSLKYSGGNKYQYIAIRQFGDDTNTLFSQATNDIVKNNPDGIILDLRNNPGGYLDTAVDIASYFIQDGVIVSEKGKETGNKDYRANSGETRLKNYKVAVLVNEGSASAAEILAGALRDRFSSKLIGQKTFGKGSVQELIELFDGSALKVTVAKWYTPAGVSINGEGLKPDIEVDNVENSDKDAQLNRAMEYLTTGK